jgi:hypothetical protein
MLPIDPPAPIIDQLPTPIAGLFAAKVTIVNPQVVALLIGPGNGNCGFDEVLYLHHLEGVHGPFAIVHLRVYGTQENLKRSVV